MRRYETIIIVRPGASSEDELNGIIEKFTGIIKQDGGTVAKIDKWGLKKLAYVIKKEQQGSYVFYSYESAPAAVAEMERQLRIDDRVIKYLTVKLDAEEEVVEAVAETTEAEA
ncbi:MAG: 30S ribosomal protein S6 [Thermodesulfobacteriota bacterium]